MKIRNGFVSNSSSSSFLIVGTKVKFENVLNLNNEYIAVGPELNEGRDIIEITDLETLCVIALANDKFDIYLVEETKEDPDMAELLEYDYDKFWDLNNSEIEKLYRKKFKKECRFTDKDYCCSSDYHDLIDRHDLNISRKDIKEKMQKFLREDKLTRILKK